MMYSLPSLRSRPFCLRIGQRAAGLEIVEGDDLGADKAAFKVGMDLTGGLRGLRALF